MSPVLVRQAALEDLPTVSDILYEADSWLEQQNMGLWGEDEISPQVVRLDIQSGLFYIAFPLTNKFTTVTVNLSPAIFVLEYKESTHRGQRNAPWWSGRKCFQFLQQ